MTTRPSVEFDPNDVEPIHHHPTPGEEDEAERLLFEHLRHTHTSTPVVEELEDLRPRTWPQVENNVRHHTPPMPRPGCESQRIPPQSANNVEVKHGQD